jgi:hypothetical protein
MKKITRIIYNYISSKNTHSFTLNKDGTFKVTSHKHRSMAPIECDIKKIRNEMDFFISSNLTFSWSKNNILLRLFI